MGRPQDSLSLNLTFTETLGFIVSKLGLDEPFGTTRVQEQAAKKLGRGSLCIQSREVKGFLRFEFERLRNQSKP